MTTAGQWTLYWAIVIQFAGTACEKKPPNVAAVEPNFADSQLGLGRYLLKKNPVVDGDTLRVQGLDRPLRLIGVDTEEIFVDDALRREAQTDFDAYWKRMSQKDNHRIATPFGEETKRWAQEYFLGIEEVWLDRDQPRQVFGRFGRYLVYVWVRKNGRWRNYNLDSVRAGMSAYFTKFGFAERLHGAFVHAELGAKRDEVGIWDAHKKAYPDYPRRQRWWQQRARFVRKFVRRSQGKEDHIDLRDVDSPERIVAQRGKQVFLLGIVVNLSRKGKRPRAFLGHRLGKDLPIVFQDHQVLRESRVYRSIGDFVVVQGKVSGHGKKLHVTVVHPSHWTSMEVGN